MIRIAIAAHITGTVADALATHPDVAAAAEDDITFTVTDEGLLITVAGPDLPAFLAVLSPADALGQITVYAAESPLLAAA